MMRGKLVIIAGVLALADAACGGGDATTEQAAGGAAADVGGGAAQIAQPGPITGGTFDIAMRDIAFQPKELTVEAGSTVTFRFTNEGAIVHEAVIGDEHVQEEHAKEMAEGMEMGPSEGEGQHGMVPEVELRPGETGELTYTFDEPGTVLIGCHEPGHYEAGMMVTITVV